MPTTTLSISTVPGDVAPRHDTPIPELTITHAIITEQAMKPSNKPLVDLMLVDDEGKRYFIMVSGAIIQMLASAIGGINMRNHGDIYGGTP